MLSERRKDYQANALSLLLTISAAFLVLFVCVWFLSKDPGRTIYYMMAGPFLNRFYFGNLLNAAVPLIFTGLGMALAFQSSLFNLGGEGQVYTGGLITVLLALSLAALPGPAGIILVLTGAFLAGGIIAGISGYFRMKWNTSELITSFLISSICILLVNQLVRGPFKDPQNNLTATREIPDTFFLTRLFNPSNLNSSLFMALAGAGVLFFYLYFTHQGYETRICGLNRQFARYGGVPVERYFVIPLFLSGGLHGLAGSISVLGTYHNVIQGFSFNMGWNGIAIALIARNNPLGVIPAALFFAYLESGAKIAMIQSDVTLEIASVAQAVVFFLVTSRLIHDAIRYGTFRSKRVKNRSSLEGDNG